MIIVNDRWQITEKEGSGSFGIIFKCIDTRNAQKIERAIKLEPLPRCDNITEDQVLKSSQIYNEHIVLEEMNGQKGFPKVYDVGKQGDFAFLVMDLFWQNLEQVFEAKGRMLSELNICCIAEQMLARIESLHAAGWVHRDIKPENFMIARNSAVDANTKMSTAYDKQEDTIYQTSLSETKITDS